MTEFHGRGDWSASASYSPGDVVRYGTIIYECIVANTNTVPTNEEYWEVFARVHTESGTGPAGPQGPIGPQGPAGADGAAGAQGPTGPQGAAGSNGAPGAKGDKGDTGDPGTIVAVSATEPADPSEGDLWVDTSGA